MNGKLLGAFFIAQYLLKKKESRIEKRKTKQLLIRLLMFFTIITRRMPTKWLAMISRDVFMTFIRSTLLTSLWIVAFVVYIHLFTLTLFTLCHEPLPTFDIDFFEREKKKFFVSRSSLHDFSIRLIRMIMLMYLHKEMFFGCNAKGMKKFDIFLCIIQ